MNTNIPKDKIAQVREASNIVDVISNYLTLKRSGKSFVGLCPFHTDSAPSFNVNPNTQMFYCFGCHKGGDVFNFLMEIEKISFVEAVEVLAQKAGISLPRTDSDDHLEKEKEALYYVNRWAANLFYKNLLSPAGKEAQRYIEHRGINREMIKTFGLGYSLPLWDGLLRQAKVDSVSPDVLFKAGLVIKRPNGGYYDRFRGRFMIPILNLYKKVIGFGGRKMIDDDTPKYINSPETAIYQKGQILFGLYQSREEIRKRDQVIFVEGYTDLISLYQAGVRNVVATSGTALTPNQVRLIRRFTQNAVLFFDADAAGIMAAIRGAEIFLDENVEIKIATLPAGEDPDSFIRKHDADSFYKILAAAQSLIFFKQKILEQRTEHSTTAGKTQIINSLLESAVRIKDSIKQNLAIKEIAEAYGVDERAIMNRVPSIRTSSAPSATSVAQEKAKKPSTPTKPKDRYDRAEEDLVRLILENAALFPAVMGSLEDDDMVDPQLRQILKIADQVHQAHSGVNRRKIMDRVTDPDLSARLAQLLSTQFSETTDRDKLLSDCIVSVKKRKLKSRLSNLSREIKLAQERGLDVTDYIQKYRECQQELLQIESKTFGE
ncbi:MAG: DNA primase [Candidatus Zhuqueibacterota bacterium]